MKFKCVKGVYYVTFSAGKNKSRTITTKTRNLTDAKKVAQEAKIREIELAARAGVLTQAAIQTIVFGGQKITLASLVVSFENWMSTIGRSRNTVKNTVDTVKAFLAHQEGIINRMASDINEVHISRYINRESKAKAGSRMVALSHIRTFFVWLLNNGIVTRNPAKLVEVDMSKLSHQQKEAAKRTPFTDEEYATLLTAADKKGDPFWCAAIRIGRKTGYRLGDIAGMEWDVLRTEPGKIIVWTEKRDQRVAQVMEDDLLAVFLQLQEKPEDQVYIFPHERQIHRDPDTRAQLSVQFSRICKKAGIVGKSFHCLRHTRATEVFRQTGDIELTKQLMGHGNVKTTEGYVHA